MVDFASMLFGDFQDSIVTTFGDTIGWVVGHVLIAGLVALVWYTWIGRNHIRTQSGWGMPEIETSPQYSPLQWLNTSFIQVI